MIEPLYCFSQISLEIWPFHSVVVVSAQPTAFLAHARLTHIFHFVLDFLYRLFFVDSVALRNGMRNRWLRSTKTNTPMCRRMRTIAQQARVSSSRIPLLFVSLASTVDHHNCLCIVWNFFPPDSRVCIQTAHISIIVLCNILFLFSSFSN